MERSQSCAADRRVLAHGQALPIFALCIVAILAVCGCTIDGGMALVQRRNSAIVGDALALNATRVMLLQRNNQNTDHAIYDAIEQAVAWQKSIDQSTTVWQAWYIDASFQRVRQIRNGPQPVPVQASGIALDIDSQMPTVFLRLVGIQSLSSQHTSAAMIGPLGTALDGDVLPLGLSQQAADLVRNGGDIDINMLKTDFPLSNTIQLSERYVTGIATPNQVISIGDGIAVTTISDIDSQFINARMQSKPQGIAVVCAIVRSDNKDLCDVRGFIGIELVRWSEKNKVLIIRFVDPYLAAGSMVGSGNGVSYGTYAINLVE